MRAAFLGVVALAACAKEPAPAAKVAPDAAVTTPGLIHRGDTAPQAAGAIHTDFERGFIRAEVIAYDDYIACRGEQGAKEAGKMRLEGKEYVVRDGDVIYFRFAT